MVVTTKCMIIMDLQWIIETQLIKDQDKIEIEEDTIDVVMTTLASNLVTGKEEDMVDNITKGIIISIDTIITTKVMIMKIDNNLDTHLHKAKEWVTMMEGNLDIVLNLENNGEMITMNIEDKTNHKEWKVETEDK